ncbi:MAG: nitroreductase family protein [Paludibacteraceae bacterium]|nr:nitroreductase family protein [Paludibacteraceae bacterium]
MNLLELAKQRYSVRLFSNKEIEKEKVDYLLEVARMAPSAVNIQPWSFLVLQSEEAKKDIQACYDRDWFKTAPLYIVVCGNHLASWKRASDNKDHCDIDIAIATEHIALAAAEQGLGSCWVCNFDAALCKKLMQLPDGIEPMVILPIGYADQQAVVKEKNRKNTEDIVLYL